MSIDVNQININDVLDFVNFKKYAAIIINVSISILKKINKLDVNAWFMIDMHDDKQFISSLIKLVKKNKYRMSLSIKIVEHELKKLFNILNKIKTVNEEKVIVTL